MPGPPREFRVGHLDRGPHGLSRAVLDSVLPQSLLMLPFHPGIFPLSFFLCPPKRQP